MSTPIVSTGYQWNVMVLCLEGGGVRGYSSLLMLKRLMDKIAQLEQAKSPPKGVDIDPKHWTPHDSSFDYQWPGQRASTRQSPATDEHEQGLHLMGSESPSDPTEPPSDPRTLRREMKKRQGKYLPCHYFDYIGGTSTGGLAAIMLGRLRLEVDECIVRYQSMSQNIFGHQRISSIGGKVRPRYSSRPLVREIQNIVDGTLPEDDVDPRCKRLAAPDDLCKTVVFAALEDQGVAYLFRSYGNEAREGNGLEPKNAGPPEECEIWEAARATSAAPGYFKPIAIKQRRPQNGVWHTKTTEYIDGAMRCNDPTPVLIKDIRSHRHRRRDPSGNSLELGVKLVLTLGTGQKPKTKVKAAVFLFEHSKRMIRQVKDHLLRPGWAEDKMKHLANEDGFAYFKWHGGVKVESISLDDCKAKTFRKMTKWTEEYMDEPEIRGHTGPESDGELWKVATKLVEERRNRLIRSERKWKRFATCVTYCCSSRTCEHGPNNNFNNMQEAEHHIKTEHAESEGEDSTIDEVLPCLRGPWCHQTPRATEQ